MVLLHLYEHHIMSDNPFRSDIQRNVKQGKKILSRAEDWQEFQGFAKDHQPNK